MYVGLLVKLISHGMFLISQTWDKDFMAVVSTGSTGSIEPLDFWKRHYGTYEISKIILIESVNPQDE